MGSQIIPRSLDQRLEKTDQKGILQSNPPDQPFWIPEENPLLLAWDMTLSEYCETVRRVAGLHPRYACQSTFSSIWPDLGKADWNISLIFLLGSAYRLLHDGDEENGGYTPDPDPPQVRFRWGVGPMELEGSLRPGNLLASALACLLLMPFDHLENLESINDDEGETIPGKDENL